MLACLATAADSLMIPSVGISFVTLVVAVLGNMTRWSSRSHQSGLIVTVGGVAFATMLQENSNRCPSSSIFLEHEKGGFSILHRNCW